MPVAVFFLFSFINCDVPSYVWCVSWVSCVLMVCLQVVDVWLLVFMMKLVVTMIRRVLMLVGGERCMQPSSDWNVFFYALCMIHVVEDTNAILGSVVSFASDISGTGLTGLLPFGECRLSVVLCWLGQTLVKSPVCVDTPELLTLSGELINL